jgi:hypothetical protein
MLFRKRLYCDKESRDNTTYSHLTGIVVAAWLREGDGRFHDVL